MNVILLEPDDFCAADRAQLRATPGWAGRRLRHLHEVLRAQPGDRLRVGRIDGPLGTATLRHLDPESAELEVKLFEEPPPPSPLALVVALPRPPILRRVLAQGAALGVKRFVLLHTSRVEKSYWQSRDLAPQAVREQLLLGLEQAGDTVLPRVEERRRFRPFAEDELPTWLEEAPGLVADPEAAEPWPRAPIGPAVVIVGPEGGFVPFELERLEAAGARRHSLGRRVLRVDTAVVGLLARLAP